MTLALTAALAWTAHAQDNKKATIEVPQWVKDIKVSGYGMLQYQAEDKDGAEHNEFNLRLMRVIMDGKIGDFDWRAQVQGSLGSGPGASTCYLVDLYAEWAKYKDFRVKAGQFKRAFSFENPTHPITQGWYSYAMAINYFTGFGDRTGEKSSGGRDIGLQVQGDLFPNASGRRLLHYQVGVYNGEGINTKDKDNRKDIIGGLWVMPIEGVRIGAFGWTGSRGNMTATYTERDDDGNVKIDEKGNVIKKSVTGDFAKNRYAISAEYDKNQYTFRAEYIHSQGYGSDLDDGDKADGFYAFGIVPVIKSKLHAKARYNLYRKDKTWANSKTMYEIGANYFFSPKVQLNLEYARVNERSLAKSNYNFFDVQLDFRF